VKDKNMQIIPELTDEDGFVVTVAALERGHAARDVCRARDALEESEEEFAARFDVSPDMIFEWEFNRIAAPDPVVAFARTVLTTHKKDSVKAKKSSDRAVAAS